MTTKVTPMEGSFQAAHVVHQDRSRETLTRILVAAEQLLETREFDQLTMVELAKQARCGVGTVYGRLPSKESLLVCLHERYMKAALKNASNVLEKYSDGDLSVRVGGLCAMIVDFLAANRGVTRAITNYLYVRPTNEVDSGVADFRRTATMGVKQAAAFLAERVDRGVHRRPESACEFGLQAAIDVAQSRIVFGERSGLQIHYSNRILKKRISALLLAYLVYG